MLLETLDIKKDDIVIYSQNIFDVENNFKIIFKDDPDKKVRKIGFYDVCHFVNEYTPKNLIVYRMMTNIDDFSLHTSKFGFKIFINEVSEIVYFDPIFAIKELEEYPGTVDEKLRFRIQQIGLTTISRVDNVSNFAEIYSIDLRPYEAKYQKDKVFADAIFAFNPVYNSPVQAVIKTNEPKDVHASSTSRENGISSNKTPKEAVSKEIKPGNSLSDVFKNVKKESITNDPQISKEDDIKIIKHDIKEDKDFDYTQILKMNVSLKVNNPDEKKEFPKLIRHDTEQRNAFSEFLKTSVKSTSEKSGSSPGDHLTDLFKSPVPLIKLAEERQEEKIVLRLHKK